MSGVELPPELRPKPVQKPPEPGVSAALLAMTAEQVQAKVGDPLAVDGARWSYDTQSHQTLYVYFGDNGVVSDVRPKDIDLNNIIRKQSQ